MGKGHKSHWGRSKEECAAGTGDQGWGDAIDQQVWMWAALRPLLGMWLGCGNRHLLVVCGVASGLCTVLPTHGAAALPGFTHPAAGPCALPCGPGHPYMDAGHTEHSRVTHNTDGLKCERILSLQCSRCTPATRPHTGKFQGA